ncbi:MAG: acetyl-CoA carboxylase biotin carboxyl carrier protein [Candidatus Eremiobacteraeota bacterium]|nr:acetyl-CoA carboxylase biotin carboxyl carrier protein [Candidatus Eremiobacteraeota bacterium]MCL5055466.1 acetyl-CoA carboxylase biotin carboxyl carrier protein [Bacillota bacterium]
MENSPYIPINLILDFLNLAQTHNLEELTITTPEGKFFVSRAEAPSSSPAALEVIQSHPIPVQESEPQDSTLYKVVSPLIGVFYETSSPGAKPFVEIGDTVSPGDPLCIIEAMKVMNEVVSDTAGIIEAVLAKNGQVVETGETLFLIRRKGIA